MPEILGCFSPTKAGCIWGWVIPAITLLTKMQGQCQFYDYLRIYLRQPDGTLKFVARFFGKCNMIPSFITPNCTIRFISQTYTAGRHRANVDETTLTEVQGWLKTLSTPRAPAHVKPSGVELTDEFLIGSIANGEGWPEGIENGTRAVIEFNYGPKMTACYLDRIMGAPEVLQGQLANKQLLFNVQRQA